ncbi:ATP-binding protein [Streptantibioticus parmotrematis]|uniref:ATP-binding protein n=1 Tax=Streptantibioticus parmotrematis TaxID=2873249 RepID=UPI00207BF26F|nr:ATP-binding protein [Streptantibioticus parmotrematis]
MSLPLKRRIARAALLVAAAAPVVGLGAGSASAAGLPHTPDLGGLTNLDSASNLSGKADGLAHKAAGVVNEAGGNAAKTLAPAARQTVSETTGTLSKAAKDNHLTDQLPVHGLTGNTLPTKDLHSTAESLPVSSLPL